MSNIQNQYDSNQTADQKDGDKQNMRNEWSSRKEAADEAANAKLQNTRPGSKNDSDDDSEEEMNKPM